MQIAYFLALIFLFLALGKMADLLLDGCKALGLRINIKPIYLGFLLGLITSTPEVFIGINALANNLGAVSFGNLMGGIIVLLGFIFGLNVVLSKGIELAGAFSPRFLTLVAFYMLLPILLIFDGYLQFAEGLLLVLVYSVAIFYLLKQDERTVAVQPRNQELSTRKSILYIFIGIISLVILSKFIISTTVILLQNFAVPKFILGAILFSIGTNLPELVITIESWRKKTKGIAIGNLLGSSMANVFIAGALAMIKPISIAINFNFYAFFISFLLLIILFIVFAATKKRFSIYEGMGLLGVYILFLIFEFFLAKAEIANVSLLTF